MQIVIGGDKLQIEAGGGRITLSVEEFATLAANSQRLLRQLTLSSPESGGYIPVPTMRAEEIKAVLDAHHSSIVLEVIHQGAVDSAYELSFESANGLAEKILSLIGQVASEAPPKMQ